MGVSLKTETGSRKAQPALRPDRLALTLMADILGLERRL